MGRKSILPFQHMNLPYPLFYAGEYSYMPWKRMIAYTAGQVNSELLEDVEYLREENRILKSQMDRTYLDS